MAPTKKKWNERDTLRFIELYEAEEVLWNVKMKEYKNKDARNAAIQRLIQNLNIEDFTAQDVNVKINNIRSTYSQEKLKIKKSSGTGSGADDIYVPSLAWFEIADRFLSGVIKSRKTFQNVDNSSALSSDMPASSSQETPLPNMPARPSQDIHTDPSQDIQANPSQDIQADPSPAIHANSSPNTPYSAQSVGPSSRKRMKKALPQHIVQTIQTLEQIKEQAINSREVEDEFSHFGKNIACQLQQLPLIDALDVQSEILNLIKNKRQAILRSSERRNSSPSEYFLEYIPQHIFPTQENEQNIQGSLLEEAVKNISGFDQKPNNVDP